MLYGEAKLREISRSVLPASRRGARSASKEKRQWNRSARRRMNIDLTEFFEPGGTAEGVLEDLLDYAPVWFDSYTPDEKGEMSYIRSDRRQSDNLGPVMSWAGSRKDDFEDPHDLIAYFKRNLPNNLAGRHALSHIDSEYGPKAYRFRSYRTDNRMRVAARYVEWVERMEVLLLNSHAELNRQIRRNHTRRLHCHKRVRRSFEKPASPKGYTPYTWETCMGRVDLTQANFYDRDITCPECHGRIPNSNIRPISTMGEVDEFFGSINPVHDGKLLEWMEAEFKRHKAFMAEPALIERPRALASFLWPTSVAA